MHAMNKHEWPLLKTQQIHFSFEEENTYDLHAKKEEKIIICCGIVVSEWIHLKRVLNLMNKMHMYGRDRETRERKFSFCMESNYTF